MAVEKRIKRNREGKCLVAVRKMRQGKRQFERKKKRYNLCSDEMEVIKEQQIKRLSVEMFVAFSPVLFVQLYTQVL